MFTGGEDVDLPDYDHTSLVNEQIKDPFIHSFYSNMEEKRIEERERRMGP